MQHWIERLRRTGGNERTISYFMVDRQQLGWLVAELAVGANRLHIADGLAKDVRAVGATLMPDGRLLRSARSGRRRNAINYYVDWLGFERVARDHRPGLPPQAPTRRVFDDPPVFDETGPPPLREEPLPIYNVFAADWMRGLVQLAMDNVGYEGGREITPEQNDRLGLVLEKAGPSQGSGERVVTAGGRLRHLKPEVSESMPEGILRRLPDGPACERCGTRTYVAAISPHPTKPRRTHYKFERPRCFPCSPF